MDRWWLAGATLLAAVGGGVGLRCVLRGRRSTAAVLWMVGALLLQFAFLWLRGSMRGACPLRDLGEVLAFLAWSLTLCYLLVGRAYRWSPVGVFTAPVVVLFQCVALLPGVLDAPPESVGSSGPWGETHAATAVLSYGAFALAAVTAAMFLVLDRQLKERQLESGWFRAMPPVRELLVALVRLLALGWLGLTVGVVCGWMARSGGGSGSPAHFYAALVTWVGYSLLLGIVKVRGVSGRRLAVALILWFLVSLGVFAFL